MRVLAHLQRARCRRTPRRSHHHHTSPSRATHNPARHGATTHQPHTAAADHPQPMVRRLATEGWDQLFPTLLCRERTWLQHSVILHSGVEESRFSCHPRQLSLTTQGAFHARAGPSQLQPSCCVRAGCVQFGERRACFGSGGGAQGTLCRDDCPLVTRRARRRFNCRCDAS